MRRTGRHATHLLCLAVLWSSFPSSAQQVFTQPPLYVTAIELVADVRDERGRTPLDLKPTDFRVLEDGVERTVIGVDSLNSKASLGTPELQQGTASQFSTSALHWQIVIYFDAVLSSPQTIRAAAESLSRRAAELVMLGPVDVVVANPKPALFLSRSRDVNAVRRALREAASVRAQDWLVRHRRQFLFDTDLQLSATARELEPMLHEEITAIQDFRRALVEWLTRYARDVPRALVVISDGFELDVSDFYLRLVSSTNDELLLRAQYNAGPDADALAKLLAASSWTVLGVHGTFGGGQQWINDASRSSVGSSARNPLRQNTFATTRADAPLRALADATGGWSGTLAKLPAAISSLQDRVVITYQVSRRPDGRPHRLAVHLRRPGLTIRTFAWSADATEEDVAAARTLALLHSEPSASGDLPLSISVAPTGDRHHEELFIRVPIAGLATLLGGRKPIFRVTIAGIGERQPSFAIHRLLENASGDELTYRALMEVDSTVEVAVTVEELTTGLWGGMKVNDRPTKDN